MAVTNYNKADEKTAGETKFSVAFLLLNDFTIFAFPGVVDALRLAGDDADNSQQRDCHWTIIAPDLKPIRANAKRSPPATCRIDLVWRNR